MQKNLENLRDKLSDLSKRNRSLRLLKIYDKWNFDLAQLNALKDTRHSTTEAIAEKLTHGSGNILLLSTHSQEELALRLSHCLTSLNRNISAIDEETGVYNLYVGYPFLTGKMQDCTFIQAPIFLFPIKLSKGFERAPGWIIDLDSHEEIILNRTLLLAFQKYNQLKLDEKVFDDARELPEYNFEEWLCELLNNYGISCSQTTTKVMEIKQYTQKEIPDNIQINKFEIKPYMVMGHYPQGNSAILKDYEELIQIVKYGSGLGIANDILLEDNTETNTGNWDFNGSINIDSIPETNNYHITNLDASQEEVILSVEKQKGLVVHGPPGTGKSQVIVNLVSNSIAKHKKVLVVCQKRAALDVVYQRLDLIGLANHVALVHDANADRKKLYEKIDKVLSGSSAIDITKPVSQFESVSRDIEEKTNYFNILAHNLWAKRKCGLSLYELYSGTKALKADEILLNLGGLTAQIDASGLLKLLPLLKHMGNYFGRFGHENYSWVNRKSFSELDNIKLYELKQTLNQIIVKSESILNSTYYSYNDRVSPGMCWDNENTLFEGVKRIDSRNKKATYINNIRLWIWKQFKGRLFIQKLGETNIRSFASDEWKTIEEGIAEIYEYGNNTNVLKDTVDRLKDFLNQDIIDELREKIKNGVIPINFFKQLRSDLENDYAELVEMDRLLAQLDNCGSELLAVVLKELPVTQNPLLGELWTKVIKQSFYIHWINDAERGCSDLMSLSTNKYAEMMSVYKKLIKSKHELIPIYIKTLLKKQVNSFCEIDMKVGYELKHQVAKLRKVWPIRKLVSEFINKGLLDVIPVWLVSPETVSSVFPMKEGLFDLVIFDEASQCPIENGVPSVFRAKKLVVAGDEKQLPPFDLFKANIDSEDEEEFSEGIADSDSLLNLSKRCYPSKLLAWHYRSKYEELINFSNHAFYRGEMQIAPNVKHRADPPAIAWVQANGLWINQQNDAEAKWVCSVLKKLFKTYADKSIGVITFNRKQHDLIQDYIDKYIESDAEFGSLYRQIMSRDIDERLFVKNIENVQGDERDIIVFSIGYAKNVQGRVAVNFGTLNQQGGENRLNVAITRAKEKVVVVCSISPEEINVSDSINLGPKLFKSYLQYAYAVANKNYERVFQILKEINPVMNVTDSSETLQYDSIFEEEVYNQLVQRGYEVRTQVGCSGYRIDMAVVHPKDKTQFILGIECDGAMYHSARCAKERDIYRQRFLEKKGWTIVRIWSRNWWQNSVKEIERIESNILKLIEREEETKEAVYDFKNELLDNKISILLPPQKSSHNIEEHKTSIRDPQKEYVPTNNNLRIIRSSDTTGHSTAIEEKNKVTFGDVVVILDHETKESFSVRIEPNKYNKTLMTPIELELLGKSKGSYFEFKGIKYLVSDIDRSKQNITKQTGT